MSLVTTEINELRRLLVNFKDRTISREDLDAQLSIYNQTDKRVKSSLKQVSLMLKAGLKREAKQTLSGSLFEGDGNIDLALPIYDRTVHRGNEQTANKSR
jgi:hypothetical protein